MDNLNSVHDQGNVDHAEKNNINEFGYIVAIGASAGGLQALQEFFQNINPDTDAAFVVIQHLSPDYKSMMDEILSRETPLPIKIASNGDQLKPNHIFLIPPGQNISISKNKLILIEIKKEMGLNLPIDIFFRSAAANFGYRCIGVILSGTGSDGSRGIKAIKEAGGLTMIQDPDSAIFSSMPLNAKENIAPDFVLPPKEIAEEIAKYLTHPLISKREKALRTALENREHLMDEIFDLINNEHRIDFSNYRPSTIAHRLERRMGINQIVNIEDYLNLIKRDKDELSKLNSDLLIGVTSFFRDEDAFTFLQKQVIEKLVLNTTINDGLRIWDVACSTGEEAYSLAILFAEALERFNLDIQIKIFATDVDQKAIADASEGVFSEESLRDIKPEWIKKYFYRNNQKYSVSPQIRRMLLFAVHDVTKDPAFSSLDLVVCRNALIYFQHSAQKRILSTLHFSLKRPGYLFLGPSESIDDFPGQFRVLSENYKIFENISESRASALVLEKNRKQPYSRVPLVSNIIKNHRAFQTNDELNKICEFLVREYLPVTFVLDTNYNIDYIYGDAGPFLIKPTTGKITTNLLDLISPQLRIPVNTALEKVEKDKKRYSYTGVKFRLDNEAKHLYIEVAPYFSEENLRNFIVIVCFQENAERKSTSLSPLANALNNSATQTLVYDEKVEPYIRIKQLEEELLLKHSYLQATIQELESTNEEIQSSNEELLLSNEELQSTNEEIQSMNEELYTLNSEYQQKIVELTETNNDIQNLMKSTEIGMIFLDSDYNIRRFTPNTTSYVPLVDGDIGRSFFHFSNRLQSGTGSVENDIRSVSVFGQPVERKISFPGNPNTRLFVRILPYTNQSQETNGVVITITDISNFENTERKLEQAVEMLGKSFDDHLVIDKQRHYHLAVLDDDPIDGKNIQHLINKSVYSTYSVDIYSDYNALSVVLENKKYDVILLDYYLGPMSASELFASQQNCFKNTPIVLMSGKTSILNKTEEFNQYSVYDMIPKNDLSTPLLERSVRFAIRMHEVRKFTSSIAD